MFVAMSCTCISTDQRVACDFAKSVAFGALGAQDDDREKGNGIGWAALYSYVTSFSIICSEPCASSGLIAVIARYRKNCLE